MVMTPYKAKRRCTWRWWSTNGTIILNADTISPIHEALHHNWGNIFSSNSVLIPRFHQDCWFCNLYTYGPYRFSRSLFLFSACIYFILHLLLLNTLFCVSSFITRTFNNTLLLWETCKLSCADANAQSVDWYSKKHIVSALCIVKWGGRW